MKDKTIVEAIEKEMGVEVLINDLNGLMYEFAVYSIEDAADNGIGKSLDYLHDLKFIRDLLMGFVQKPQPPVEASRLNKHA